MRKTPASSSVVLLALCTLLAAGCGGTEKSDPTLNTGGDNLGADTTETSELDGGPGTGGIGKITICHVPPGNPANAHTITVGLSALPAHLRHGDTAGACGDDTCTSDDGGTCGPDDGGSSGGEDAGTGGDVDAGPACLPMEAACDAEGSQACCNGLSCVEGQCWPVIG